MNNAILATLVIKGVLNEEEATSLAEELSFGVMPTNFKDSLRLVRSVFDDIAEHNKTAESVKLPETSGDDKSTDSKKSVANAKKA